MCSKFDTKLKSEQSLFFSNVLFLKIKCAPFILKIEESFNIDD